LLAAVSEVDEQATAKEISEEHAAQAAQHREAERQEREWRRDQATRGATAR
jgi:hypothetical protein